MQGCKQFEPRLFYEVSLDGLVPADHLVRRLAAIDLAWVRAATADKYSYTGKPSVDPVVVAKLLILGFLYGVRSERQLLRDVQVNLAYRWYLGYDLDEKIPDHSVLSKARQRLGLAFFQQLFADIVERCRRAGLIRGENLLVDSTVVAADASLESVTALRYDASSYWQQLEQTSAASEEAPTPPGLGQKRPRQQRTSDQKYSPTDPEASLSRRPGQTAKPAYKTHFGVDDAHGVITAVTATGAAVDDTAVVPELLGQHRQACQNPQRVVGDHLYGSQDCLGYLQAQGIDTVIPGRRGGNRHGRFGKEQFAYDSQADVFRCPAGQILRRRRTQRKDCKAFYSCDRGVCRCCPLRAPCVAAKDPDACRQVTRFDTPYGPRAEAWCRSRLGRRLLRKRQTCIEGLFGQGKNHHGLRRARWRRLVNMHIQSLLTATVLNVKQLLKALARRAAGAASAAIGPREAVQSAPGFLFWLLSLRKPYLTH